MRTLHLCHWRDTSAFTEHASWLGPADAVVVYGKPSPLEIEQIQSHMQTTQHPWYLYADHADGGAVNNNPNVSVINANQWLQLITEYDHTWAWK